MSDITVVRRHALPLAKARDLVQQAAEALAHEFGLESEWRGDTLLFQRAGIRGHIHVREAEIELQATLGLLLKPLRARLISHIERELNKHLPEPQPTGAAKKPARKTAPTH